MEYLSTNSQRFSRVNTSLRELFYNDFQFLKAEAKSTKFSLPYNLFVCIIYKKTQIIVMYEIIY